GRVMSGDNLCLLLHWVREREAVRVRRERGDPKPWTDDPVLRDWSFCQVHREHDRVTRWIADNWRHRNDYDVWFAMVVARFVNEPATLAEIGFPAPWDPERFLAGMAARKARGETLYRSSYRIRPPGRKEKAEGFDTTPKYQAAKVF